MTNNLDRLLWEQSVAVVGALTDSNKLGHQILANILAGGYEGVVYPVNPKANKLCASCQWSLSKAPLPSSRGVVRWRRHLTESRWRT